MTTSGVCELFSFRAAKTEARQREHNKRVEDGVCSLGALCCDRDCIARTDLQDCEEFNRW